MSFSVKFRFAVFASAAHAPPDPDASISPNPSGSGVASVNNASANAPAAAIAHFTRIETLPATTDSLWPGLNERRHALDLVARLARNQHEGAPADAPDRGLVTEHHDQLARSGGGGPQ